MAMTLTVPPNWPTWRTASRDVVASMAGHGCPPPEPPQRRFACDAGLAYAVKCGMPAALRMARGKGRDPRRAHAGMGTANGVAQACAARWGLAQFVPGADVVGSLAGAMRGLGPRASAGLVVGTASGLDAELRPGSLEMAAVDAAAGVHVDDPRRPMAVVAAQVRLVRAAGPGAVAAARALALHVGAFNSVMPGWAAAADEYGRDGAAAEAADAVETGMFVRRPGEQFGFTAMSIDLRLKRHEHNQVKMRIRRAGILSPTYVVEYCPFMARLDADPEEIDSPKAAGYARECEVRMPDGARVARGSVRVMARRRRLDAGAWWHLWRLRRLGAAVELKD